MDLISISENNLSFIDLSNNLNIKSLNVQSNNLSSIDISVNTMINSLYLELNDLSSINLSNNINLKLLYIDGNEISNIDLSSNENIELVSISENNISALNISNNNNLNDLNVLNNPLLKCIQVNTIQIGNLFNLNWKKDLSANYSLNCEVNELSDVTIYNVITLNDNGKNDYLIIKNIEFFPQNNISIFNRDGTLIYSIDDYGKENRLFRGMSKSNKELPTGSYIYVFNYYHPILKKTIIKKGFLTIIND